MPFNNSPLSKATREQVEAELRDGTPPRQIATAYKISLRTVYTYLLNLKAFGEVRPVSGLRRGPLPVLDAEMKEVGKPTFCGSY